MGAQSTDIYPAEHPVYFQGPRPKMAKVQPNFLQERADKAAWGSVLARVPSLLNLTDSQFAARLGVPASQLSAWHAGTENAAMWRYKRDGDVFNALQWAQAEANGQVVRPVIELPPLKVGT